MPTAVDCLQLEPAFISSPENKTCQDRTGKLIPDFQGKNGEHCALSNQMKAAAGM